jgi:hypothetical protein
MLTQFGRLRASADGRYATAEELQFLKDYFKTFQLRLSAYQKIQAAEKDIVRQVQEKLQSRDPDIFNRGSEDLTAKWRLDLIRVLRHSCAALLSDDRDRLRNDFLLWFKSILHAFQVQHHSELTYSVMQDVVKGYLTPEEAALFSPILDLTRKVLGG